MGVLLSPPMGIGPRLKIRSSGGRAAMGCSRVSGRRWPHRHAEGSVPYAASRVLIVSVKDSTACASQLESANQPLGLSRRRRTRRPMARVEKSVRGTICPNPSPMAHGQALGALACASLRVSEALNA